MAAAVTSPWGKKFNWADESEQSETLIAPVETAAVETADFPSLSAAVTTKAKKKKPQPVSLGDFVKTPYKPVVEEVISLPTGPRERSAEELADRGRLGGGFRSYGGDRERDRDDRRREVREPMGPSRADEADDWGSMKKPVERRERDRGFFGGSDSKADESGDWKSSKSSFGPPPSDGRRERRVGVGFASSGAADSENWLKKKEEEGGKRFGGAFDSLRERRGGFDGGDSDNWGRKKEDAGFGSVGAARPRLNLQPRTVPVGEQNGSGVAKPKGSNPFGEARPREEVLKAKGKDWKEIDEKLEAMKIKEIKEADVAPRRGFGGSNGRGAGVPEVRAERSWRKPDSVDVSPQSAEKVENGVTKKVENGVAENVETGVAEKVESGVAEEAQDLQE